MNEWYIKKGILLGIIQLCAMLSYGDVRQVQRKVQLTTVPEKLQLVVNQQTDPYTVRVEYILNVPPDYITSCARLVYRPYFVAPGEEYELTPLVISGKAYLRQEKRLEQLEDKQPGYPDAMHLMANGDGMKIKLSQTVPFRFWMLQSKLRATISVEACDREEDLHDLTLAKGMFYLPLGPGPVRVEYVKELVTVQKQFSVDFIFPVGHDLFDPEYNGNADDMQKMVGWVDSLRRDSAMRLEKIVMTGTCSPFGSLSFNTLLAEKRARQMKQLFMKRKFTDENLIRVNTVPEDWQGLRKLVAQSDISDKAAVFRVLDGDYTDRERKLLLQELPEFEYIKSNLFPALQKVTCDYYYTRKEEMTKIVPE